MDVKTLCLGLLTFGAASGYDLKKRFEESFSFFFSAGYGSIYPALAYLSDTGLVTCEEVAQDGRPDRKVYRITEAGREHFEAALKKDCPAHKMRSEFLAMLFFAHLMPGDHLNDLLDHQAQEMETLLVHLKTLRQRGCDREGPGVAFVCGFGESIAKAALDYISQHRAGLSADVLAAPPARRARG